VRRELHAAGHGARAPAFPSGRLLDPCTTPLLPPSSRVPSVPRLADPSPPIRARRRVLCRRPWLASPESLFRPANPLQADPNRPSRDLRPEIEDTPSGVNLLKSPWIFLSPNPPSLAYFPECAIPFRKRKLHCLSQKYAFSIYRNAIRTVSLIELSF